MSDRTQSIGASEVAALFGCSPWQSEYGLWARKVGLLEEQEQTERMRAGNYLERAILDEWTRRQDGPLSVTHNTESRALAGYRFITATPDALISTADGVSVADVKTVEPMRRRDWDGGIPEHYRVQLQQQMLVTGARRAVLIAMFGFRELSHQWIDADPALHEEIIKRCVTFWKRVQGELPPPDIDGHDATTEALKARRPGARVIELPLELRELDEEFATAQGAMSDAKKKIAMCMNKFRAALGDANTGVWPDGTGYRITVVNKKEHIVKASTYTQLKRIKAKDAVEQWDGEDE